jgi:ribosomal 50S subunit-recycling heat shock protein
LRCAAGAEKKAQEETVARKTAQKRQRMARWLALAAMAKARGAAAKRAAGGKSSVSAHESCRKLA